MGEFDWKTLLLEWSWLGALIAICIGAFMLLLDDIDIERVRGDTEDDRR